MAGQYIIPEVSGVATGAAWVDGGMVNARELVVMAHVGTHRLEVGTVLKTCPSPGIDKTREGKLSPTDILVTSQALCCRYSTLVLYTYISPWK